jgi:hypothetical protein
VGPDDTYDVKKYLEMLVKATEEILIHFGYDVKRLAKVIDPPSYKEGEITIPPFGKGRLGGIL